jgi:SNF2 family DNA or RNA helicase
VGGDLGEGGEGGVSTASLEKVLRCRQACALPALLGGAALAASRARADAACPSALAPVVRALADLCDDDDNADLLDLIIEDGAGASSTKQRYVVADLLDAWPADKAGGAGGGPRRALVFCDWIAQIDAMAHALRAAGIATLQYHGGMDADARAAALRTFEADDGGRSLALLLQIQCGGTGLNLQAATRVYLLSPQWNPCVEAQALGRAHRMGQTRPVVAQRLVMRGTVDEHFLAMQRRKLAIIAATVDGVPQEGDLA